MTTSTVLLSLAGGALIGLASAGLMAFFGRIAGVSGIIGSLLKPAPGDILWRALFVAGLVAGGVAMTFAYPTAFTDGFPRSLPAVVAAGLLVGFGTRLGSGCTSGHGICGTSRLSPRSLIATVTFMATGGTAVFVVNQWFGGVL